MKDVRETIQPRSPRERSPKAPRLHTSSTRDSDTMLPYYHKIELNSNI
uniref:Uncharacterized protein n=1 Tax=Knipowitschia caucasica TaxID=637954 RepID=A0AAV2KIR7_KNICA